MVVALVRDKDKDKAKGARMCGGTRDCDGETTPTARSERRETRSRRFVDPQKHFPAYRARLMVTGSSPHNQMLRALFIPSPFFYKHISRADSASAVAIDEEALTIEYSANNF